MNFVWCRFEDLTLQGLYDALTLRCRGFILEQGPYLDTDGLDQHAWHLLGRDEAGALVAYLRVVDPGRKYDQPSIGRVVTDPDRRGQRLGAGLVREGVARCEAAWPGRGIRISAQAHLKAFYRGFGFEAVGDAYLEDGIPHLEMEKQA